MIFTFDLWKRLIADDPALFMRYAVADGFTPGAIGALWDRRWTRSIAPRRDRDRARFGGPARPGHRRSTSRRCSARSPRPTLVIGAEDDRWVDVSHSRTLAAAIPSARLEVLPAGHIVIQELAGDVARLLHGHVDAEPMSRADQHEELDPATKARWLAYGRPSEDRPRCFATSSGCASRRCAATTAGCGWSSGRS